MPFIVTVKRPCPYDCADEYGAGFECDECNARPETPLPVSERAVATLEVKPLADVLRPLVRHSLKALQWVDMMNALIRLPESGGSVGPLPDGTVIEVERVSWGDLHARSGHEPADWWGANSRILAAYNAKRGQS